LAQAILIVLDGLGVGALPDADKYGDAGSDTLGNMARAVGGLTVPVLERMGLGNVHTIAGLSAQKHPTSAFGRMAELSAGKDSTTGHWELMGLITDQPFPTYPQGFPAEVIQTFRDKTGYDVLGNVTASGTEIIQRLGDEHVSTGKLIVYTSADSVFQIAAHERIVPLPELYRVCEITRDFLIGPHQVSRVIARPFRGQSGAYVRTPNRRDFSVVPPAGMLLPVLSGQGVHVVSIGKIYDLYAGQGIAQKHAARNNDEGMETLQRLYDPDSQQPTLYLLNLVDFDMLWGHRNNPAGMAAALERFDSWLGSFASKLHAGDLLLITADHGNDPTTPSTDHSREYVPLLACLGVDRLGLDLGTRETFADVAATLAAFFTAPPPASGTSFWLQLQGHRAGG
jgi:phosphopentomutase